jgi:hypothetical protein
MGVGDWGLGSGKKALYVKDLITLSLKLDGSGRRWVYFQINGLVLLERLL